MLGIEINDFTSDERIRRYDRWLSNKTHFDITALSQVSICFITFLLLNIMTWTHAPVWQQCLSRRCSLLGEVSTAFGSDTRTQTSNQFSCLYQTKY